MAAIAQTIPVLDLTDFVGPEAASRHTFVQTLGQALTTVGFFALDGHGVQAEVIQSAYAAATAVFSLPEAQKAQYELAALQGQRGYIGFGREHAKGVSHPDLKEFWHIGRASGTPANLWPEAVPAFQPAMMALFTQLETCAQRLLEACAEYLDLPHSQFRDMTLAGPTLLRVAHYPPIPAQAHPASMRAAPHEDINLITLLCEATAPGLELLQPDGRWLPIAAIPGQIIVDTGDMLQNLTNGLFKSTTHRVRNPIHTSDRRFSLPFFVHPRPEVSLAPLPDCLARTGGSARFPDITAGDYLTQRLHEIGLA